MSEQSAQPAPETESGATSGFTTRFEDVLERERERIDERREAAGEPRLAENDELWGLALSGGGVRSATFSLGVIQALLKRKLLRRFDYLSTVSGGGYIGSCLSSLLSKRAGVGVDWESSPFGELGAGDSREPRSVDETLLSVRHQMHHLRMKGNYLTPRSKGLFSRDVHRAVGTTLAGTVHHIIMFAVAATMLAAGLHLFLLNFDRQGIFVAVPAKVEAVHEREQAQEQARHEAHDTSQADELGAGAGLGEEFADQPSWSEAITASLTGWWELRWAGPYQKAKQLALASQWFVDTKDGKGKRPSPDLIEGAVFTFIAGFAWAMLWIAACIFLPSFWEGPRKARQNIPSGATYRDYGEELFTKNLNLWSVVLSISLMFYARHKLGDDAALLAFFVPALLALGSVFACMVLVNLNEHRRSTLVRRSFFGIVQGASWYGLAAALLIPAALFLTLAFSGLWTTKFVGAIGALLVSRFLSRSVVASSALPSRARVVLIDIGLCLGIVLAVSTASDLLLSKVYPFFADGALSPKNALLTMIVAFSVISLMGLLADSNRVSPHDFYRDRLVESYLQTGARVARNDPGARQGHPIETIRDDGPLLLTELGAREDSDKQGPGPYHLVITALNLQGTSELNRKTMLSDHFVFTRDYVGSSITGWVPTCEYCQGEVTLARAMTISAAAAGSAAGFHSSFRLSFLATLFNARLGYWTDNPWSYRKDAKRLRGRLARFVDGLGPSYTRLRGLVRRIGLELPQRVTYWPGYLARELTGRSNARKRLVNLSDGGHTGDNLGLLPLLRRRCSTIFVVDAECDSSFEFGSFNNAVRMAFIEENIQIDIQKLEQIVPTVENEATGLGVSQQGVAIGTIEYPAVGDLPASQGQLVYLKAALRDGLRADIINYARTHRNFPHQSTADQFFDDAQFEAYRALGWSIGNEAADSYMELEYELQPQTVCGDEGEPVEEPAQQGSEA